MNSINAGKCSNEFPDTVQPINFENFLGLFCQEQPFFFDSAIV